MEEATQPKPKIVVLGPPASFSLHESLFSRHFHCLKAYESNLPLPEFLAAANSAGVSAMLTTNYGTPINADTVLRHIPSLQCIVTTSAGVDHIDLVECRRRGIAVVSGADIHSDDCADMALSLALDVLRLVSAADRFVKTGKWATAGDYPLLGNRLSGKRVGIVGYGSIGSKTAKRFEAFGCSISYTSRKQKEYVSHPFYSDVSELAANSDILVACCALTDQTRHIINKQVLSALGRKGIVINIARGAVVDEDALVKCLVDGEIAGAGLDVFEKEAEVPVALTTLENVILSPYLAWGTTEGCRNMCEHVIANFETFFYGKPLLSPVERE